MNDGRLCKMDPAKSLLVDGVVPPPPGCTALLDKQNRKQSRVCRVADELYARSNHPDEVF